MTEYTYTRWGKSAFATRSPRKTAGPVTRYRIGPGGERISLVADLTIRTKYEPNVRVKSEGKPKPSVPVQPVIRPTVKPRMTMADIPSQPGTWLDK